ncbi:MlaD family protein [Nocardia vaccinii]|uniref:MlaD family protein n=1 Tax=Nocardia vaccinii TaxID=1822 RepID=UPI00082AD7C7|nr:MlaD family protein [Nocardia vaccinii]
MAATRSGIERGPSRWGLRVRGLAVLLILSAIVVMTWRATQPDHSGQVRFGVAVTALGDGVGPGTAVRMHGTPIGSVIAVHAEGPGRQLVTLGVDAAHLRELSTTLGARFVSSNVFGTTAVELTPAAGGAPITAGTVVQMGDRAGNDTVTRILRDSGRAVLDVITSELAVSVDGAAQLTERTAPLVASMLLAVRTLQRTQDLPLSQLLPKLAGTAAGTAAFMPSALGILDALASVRALDDDRKVALANDTISEVSNLVFSFAGRLVGALGPLSDALDMMLDTLIPLTHGLHAVNAQQVRRLITGLDGALRNRDGHLTLDTELLLQGFPAFRMPLQSAGAGR